MEKVNSKIYAAVDAITQQKVMVILFGNANTGWNHVVFQPVILPDGSINEVRWVTASKTRVAQDIEPVLKQLYSNSKKALASANSCPILTSYRATLKQDLSLICYDSKTGMSPLSYEDKDVNGVSVKEYVLNNFGWADPQTGTLTVGFDLEDPDVMDASVSGVLKPYDINGHDPFNNLDGSDAARLSVHTNQVLKDSVIKSKLYADIMNYLKFDDEAIHQKGLLIYGVPGTGKTTAVRVMAEECGLPYAAITGNPALTEEDLFGYVIPNDDDTSTKQWVTAWTDVLKVAQAGGVVVFDEANNFSPAVQIGLNNVVYGENRFIKFQDKVYNVHPKTIFVVTTNFGEQGNNPMNGAFKQRFYPILATEFNAALYGEYLSKLYPAIDSKAMQDYVKFMYTAIDYTRKTFDNLDRYSPDTPALYTRAISQILTMTFTLKSLRQALGNFVFAITHGVEDNKTKVQAFLTNFDKEIINIEQQFFMNKQIVKDAKKALKDMLAYGEDVGNTSAPKASTNIDDVFDKAANSDSSSADSIANSLNNLQW